MKKLFLIPTILASATPLVCMVACNPDAPVPPGPSPEEDWKVTKQEMEDALSMKDVEYLQLSSDYETIDRVLGTLHSEKTIDDMIISPSSSYYHNQYYDITDPVKPIIKSASETYQIKNDETFTAYSRNFLISINWDVYPDLPLSEGFWTPQSASEKILMQLYKVFVKAGIPFEPDSVNKCYTASFSDEIFENKASEQCSFYFKDKKVVKMVFASVTEDGEDYIKATEEVLMDYQEVKPGQVPEVVSYDVDGDSKFIHDESPKLTSSDFVVDTTKEFVFNIDTALYEDPTVWGTNTSYLMFFNEKNELVTDIDFDVIICSINEEIFLPEANQEPTSGHYYKVDGGLYGVTDGVFDCDNNIISLVDVKFNNHNGETLFACWSNQLPHTSDPEEDWEVTTQEMVDAIKFANVNYLQIDAIMARNIVELERINKFFVFNLSPNVYFSENSPMHGQIVQHNKQTFVKEEEGIYTKKTRNLSVEDEWTGWEECPSTEFVTVEWYGTQKFLEYQAFIDSGQTFAPDEHNKCYTATRETPLGLETLTYYFNNKKLIKSVFYVNADQTQDISVYNYGYQEIVPEVPTDCRYDINTDESIPFSTPILTGEISSIDTANEFYLAIDCSKCEKATQWDSSKSYIEFYDNSGQKLTDIDFDVIFYSIDDTVFSHVLESELDEGLYYCKDNMICAQTESDISTSTQMKIVVKFNNHNGEDINVKWSNQPLQ